MRHRRQRVRLDMRIPREVTAGILVVAALLLLYRSAGGDVGEYARRESVSAEPAGSTAEAFWPSRGDSGGGRADAGERAPALVNPSGMSTTITVYNDDTGKTELMDLEVYIYHVVAAEVPAAYQAEAIRAQAVAARTYALYGMEHGGCSKGADVCTDSAHCQAFTTDEALKRRWGSEYDALSAKIRDAVAYTAGEVVTYEGKPIHALFHAVSGGRTEDALAVFNMNLPYLKSVISKGEEDAPRYKETYRFTRDKLAKLLNSDYSGAKVAAPRLQGQIEIKKRLTSGQISSVRIGSMTITGREFRKTTGIASANFTIGYTDKEVYIYTTGYGHGVGMSQAGANAMALKGSDYREILAHYYTDTTIELYTRNGG